MSFTVNSHHDRFIYSKLVKPIDLTAGPDDIARAWEDHNAQSRLAIACVNDRIEPDDFLDGLFDVMGKRVDPFLDELVVGLALLVGDD